MNLATVRDAGQREARAEWDQLAATGEPEAVAGAAWEPGGPSREEIAEKYRATALAEFSSAATPRTSAVRERFRELRDIAPARELARLLKAASRWLRPPERRTPPTAFRMALTLPETPSLAEMTIIETPFRIPRYMDHPEWRPR